ncbi:type VII secretion target [Amycolatopsis sp. H20-H5]|uniref:type VII secretion target n=1 Tax=Amycolatopsis sp. H20-H5 TaxID=3046309 RepID=UPI002DB6693B|nr:type VII secretion target [Amycolatopsis sp. H20-H5]MEC3975224.1 type VII secretion target [Amycolatopsis sp. H20-H5]
MAGQVTVDVGHIRRLSKEFRASADELRARIGKFREQTEITNGAYGETPNAEEAEHEYRRTVQQTLERLEKMHLDLLKNADSLSKQAKDYEDTEAENASSVTSAFRAES